MHTVHVTLVTYATVPGSGEQTLLRRKRSKSGRRVAPYCGRMQIGQTAAMANAAASGPAGVRIKVQLAVRVAQEIETVNQKLCDRVLATIEPVQSAAAVVLWSQSLAVRSQMALVEMRSPVAELLGRVIDGSLVSGASGAKLHFWSTSPLAPEITPPRATAVQAATSGCS